MRTAARASLSVLVVDDDEDVRATLQEAVRQLGHECRTAQDGLEAWTMHQADRADVILSDWKMPRMDGLELCRRTRALGADAPYTYFIFLTGFADKDHFIRGMDAGADDYHPKPVDLDELQARLTSAQRVIALYRELAEKNSALRRDSEASFELARVDALTEVANRLRLDEDLDAMWPLWKRYGRRYVAAICDIDKFKEFNDRFGHLSGDEVLHKIAQTMRSQLREGDGLYRYGGEEFVVILPEQSLSDAALAMDRLRRAIERLSIPTVTGAAGAAVVTISVGLAALEMTRDATREQWLRRADAALYRAKGRGRNRVETDP
ncbi:MAG: diguanylate cyclase [Myxococcota bacterium]|nr:diguanylate cyclase [Myxococcota bacterium]